MLVPVLTAALGRTTGRSNIQLVAPGELLAHLMDRVQETFDEPVRLLRTYWYDGARGGVASPEQELVGALPQVKLRLGQLTSGGQKGVDGLIILDLVTLALTKSIDVAVLVSGDEDLREAAKHAQGYGVAFVLVGMPTVVGQAQSRLLVLEADHHLVLSAETVQAHLREVSASTLKPPRDPLVAVVEGLAADPRSELEWSGSHPSLSRSTDRRLVARLAELTGTHPVDSVLLREVRAQLVATLAHPLVEPPATVEDP